MSEPRKVVCCAVLALALGVTGCKRDPAPTPTPSASAARAEVPAPSGLLGDIVIQRPSQTWRALRALAGRPGQLLPEDLRLLMATLLGLSPLAADSIDGDLPIFGALVQEGAGPAFVLGIHVTNGRELIAKLTTGNTPAFAAEPTDTTGVVRLKPVGKVPLSLGVIDNYLLVAAEPAALSRAGGYVARTVSRRALSAEPISAVVPKSALSGPLLAALRTAWQARKAELEAADRRARQAHGRTPDFADPAAVIGAADAVMETAFSVIDSAESVKISAEPLADGLLLRVELKPSAGGAGEALVSGMTVGELAVLRKLPVGVAGALLLRGEPGTTASADSTSQGWLKLFGARTNSAEAKLASDAFGRWELARGGASLYAAFVGPVAGVGFWSELRDAEAFRKSARGFFELLKMPSVSAPLREFIGSPSVTLSNVRIAVVDQKVDRALVTLARKEPAQLPALIPEKLEILWLADAGQAYGAAGSSAVPLLTELYGALRGDRTNLGQNAWLESATGRSGSRAASALYVDLGALMPFEGRAGPAPALAVLGKEPSTLWFSIEASAPAVAMTLQAMAGR